MAHSAAVSSVRTERRGRGVLEHWNPRWDQGVHRRWSKIKISTREFQALTIGMNLDYIYAIPLPKQLRDL